MVVQKVSYGLSVALWSGMLGCIMKSTANRSRGGSPPMFNLQEAVTRILWPVPGSSVRQRQGSTGEGSVKGYGNN